MTQVSLLFSSVNRVWLWIKKSFLHKHRTIDMLDFWSYATQLSSLSLRNQWGIKCLILSNGKSMGALVRRLRCSFECCSFLSTSVCVQLCLWYCLHCGSQRVKQIQSNGNTLESNSCSVKRGKTKPKNCWRQVELLKFVNDTVWYEAPGRNFPLNV